MENLIDIKNFSGIVNGAAEGDLAEKLNVQMKKLPPVLSNRLEKELEEMLQLFKEGRMPYLMLVGQPGAGKSSLVNALLGQQVKDMGYNKISVKDDVWLKYSHNKKSLAVLETPPVFLNSPGKGQGVFNEIKEKCPDVILFVVSATEARHDRERDLDALENLVDEIKQVHDRDIPLIFILNQCDELEPKEIMELPTEDPVKIANINQAMQLLEGQIRARESLERNAVELVPTVSMVRFRQGGDPDTKRDFRWNIDYLANLILEELPNDARMNFAQALKIKKMSRKIGEKLVDIGSNSCGMFATEPVPLLDSPLITTIQMTMIVAIASISGKELSFRWAGEFFSGLGTNIGSTYVKMEGQRALSKIIPGFGNIISGEMSAGFTRMIGEAALEYFIEDRPMHEIKQSVKEKSSKLRVQK